MDRLTCLACPFRAVQVDINTGFVSAICDVDMFARNPITPSMPREELDETLRSIECHQSDLGVVIRRASQMISWHNRAIEMVFNSQTHRQQAAVEAAKQPIAVPAAAR